jgi:hypothetical protein
LERRQGPAVPEHDVEVVGDVPPPDVDPNGTPNASALATIIDGGPHSQYPASADTVGLAKSSSTGAAGLLGRTDRRP